MVATLVCAQIAVIFVGVSAPASQQPARDRPQRLTAGDGVIGGRVTEKGTDRPIRGALVLLAPEGNVESLETRTDGNGRYEFRNLPPGKYGVAAGPGELRATHLHQVFGELEPRTMRAGRPPAAVALAPGQGRADVDLVLTRALAIEGRVLDAAGRPLTGIQVAVSRPDGALIGLSGSASDDRGEYRVYGLAPGRYRVCSMLFGNEPPMFGAPLARFVRTCHPSARSESEAADVVLAAGDAASIDIRMRREGVHRVTGTVLDSRGVPVADAHVSLRPTDSIFGNWMVTNAHQGRFELQGVAAGRFILAASNRRSEPSADRHEAAVQIVEIGGDLDGLVLTLARGEMLRGRVVFEDAPSPPAASGMAIHLSVPLSMANFEVDTSTASVRPDGTFQVGPVFRVPAMLSVTGLPAGWALKSIRHRDRDITNAEVEFGPGDGAYPLEAVVTNRTARLTVRIVGPAGTPVAEAHPVLMPADPAGWKRVSSPDMEPQPHQGEVTFDAVLPGTYLVAALGIPDLMALQFDPERVTDVAKSAERITLDAGEHRTIDVRLRPLPEKRP
jgi:protocatechuate 3,4-dioxygenase beta subunit